MAKAIGVQTKILDFGMNADADPAAVTQALKDDTDHEIKAVFTVQTDTASSVQNDIPALRKAIDDAGLKAMQIPHGSGALDAASAEIAKPLIPRVLQNDFVMDLRVAPEVPRCFRIGKGGGMNGL